MRAVIPIAGKGTRFLPATKEVAKELLPILNIPMLHHIVTEALASGIEQIIFVTAAGKEGIENFYDRNLELEAFLKSRGKTEELELVQEIGQMTRVVSVRQKEPLGLGHAVLCAKGLIEPEEPFAVLLGDDLAINEGTPVLQQLREVSEQHNKAAVIGVIEVLPEETGQYGIIKGVETEPRTYRMSAMVERPAPEAAPSLLAASGRYVFPYSIFSLLEQLSPGAGGEYQLTDAIDQLCQKAAVWAHRFVGDRYDTGNIKGYLNATLDFALRDDKLREYTLSLMRDKVKKYE